MWNVYINRLLACAIFMQLLMVLSKSSTGKCERAKRCSYGFDPCSMA